MKKITLFTIIVLVAVVLFPTSITGHPGSGIVVDRQGHVYFLDTGSGVWKIDLQGRLIHLPGPMFHWMAIDSDDRFKTALLPSGARGDIIRIGATPALLVASDYPIAISSNGNLYYPSNASGSGLQMMGLAPSGRATVLTNLVRAAGGGELSHLNGLAAGPEGSLYYSEDNAIRRVSARRQVSTVVANLTLPTCVSVPGTTRPMLRGLAVDSRGTIYVAASGCGSVLKITSRGQITTVVQLQSPWTPTAVALFRGNIYVLEYLQTAASMAPEDRRAWLPRVRKITANGQRSIIANIDRR